MAQSAARRYQTGPGEAFYEHAGPATLAATAGDLKYRFRPDPDWGDLYTHVEQRLSMLRNWRLSWWQHWALLARYILPRRYHWLITPNTMTRGNLLNQAIVDGAGTLAMRTCAAGMMSGLTSPNRPWFRLKSAIPGFEPDRAAQIWFEEVANRIRFIQAESNFYDSLAQMYEDLVTFGTSPVIDYEDEEDIVRAYNPCAGEYFLGVGFDFRHEVFYREFVLTISQIVEMFGADNLPPDVSSLWNEKGAALEPERIVAHAIEPNFTVRGRAGREVRMVPARFTWREVYWLRGTQSDRPLSIRGFYEKPFVAPRWTTVSNDAYGRSPGMDALPDIMQLQVMTNRMAEAIEKMVRPPMLASAAIKNEPSSILPGHVTFVPNLGPQEGMRPIYMVNPDVTAMAGNIEKISARIAAIFYNDLFKMISGLDSVERRTATEIDARREEKLVLLGPVIERLQNEGLSPRIRRLVQIMARKGLLPPAPPSLRGVPVEIEYVSMLTLAQRAAATSGIERTYAFAGNIAAARPEVLDNFDVDETIRYYGDLVGVPPKLMTDMAKMQQIRQARQQQMQQAQALQLSQAGVQGAQTLSQTDVGGGQNALQAMLGTQPSAGSA